jgi:hypothetical protein
MDSVLPRSDATPSSSDLSIATDPFPASAACRRVPDVPSLVDVESLVAENQRLIRKLEDADRETRHSAIRFQATEEQMRAEIECLEGQLRMHEQGRADGDDLLDLVSKERNIEKLTRLLINGSIESVTSSSLRDGHERLVVTGRMPDPEDSRTAEVPEARSPSDDDPFARGVEDEFVQVCAENEELREQVGELQGQLARLMKAQVQSLTGELELVQTESQSLRRQSLRGESALLRHRLARVEPDGLQRRGQELESILDDLDSGLSSSDDAPTAVKAVPEEQVAYLQTTVDTLTSERNELQARVTEHVKLIQTFSRLLDAGEIGGSVMSVVADCLAIIQSSQQENTRAHEELRLVHRQLHVASEENADLKRQLGLNDFRV